MLHRITQRACHVTVVTWFLKERWEGLHFLVFLQLENDFS